MKQFSRKQLVRIALAIQRRLAAKPHELTALPLAAFERCQHAASLLYICRCRGWSAATAACSERLSWSLQELQRQLDVSLSELARLPGAATTSVREILADLSALESEFPAVAVDLRARTISVTTDEIELDGVPLGPFEIVLEVDRLAAIAPYSVVACSPHPAACDSEVTHPHVRDERLCEGEAASSIRSALAAGRILDFFVIVAQTLATYNADSAYVPLDQWGGVSCADCGCIASERTICERCDCDLCEDCYGSCTACGRNFCNSCSASCQGCQENHCESCLAKCASCASHYCERCLDEGQCQQCRREAAEEEGQAQAGPPPAPASALEIHPLCLGQAALSA